MPIFRPSARVQLALRLEEFDDYGALVRRLQPLQTGVDTAPAPAAAPTRNTPGNRASLDAQLERIDVQIADLEDNPGDFSPELREAVLADWRAQQEALLTQLGLSAGPTAANELPATIGGPSPDDNNTFGGITPQTVSIERNGPNVADEATVTIDYRDMPFDPRLLRACAIEVTLGTVTASDFEAGIGGATRDDGTLLSLVDRSRVLAGPESRLANTTRFVGWVDEYKVKLDDDGDVVEMKCRDLAALFYDTPLATGTGVDLSRPIDEGVRNFINAYPSLRGFPVVYGRPGQEHPGTPPTPGNSVPRARQARRGRVVRQQRRGDQKMSVWEHLTDTLGRVALQPVIYDYQLHICEPRTFFGDRPLRRMVYGRNLSKLEFARKLGGTKVPTIEARCPDPDIGRTRWARWPSPPGSDGFGIIGQTDPPARPQRANEPGVSGHAPDERIQTIPVRGVSDGRELQRIARNYFEQVGRQEIEGNFETHDMQSFEPDGPIDQADLLGMDSGDAVELLTAGGPRIPGSTLSASEIQALSRQARADYLRGLGWSDRVSERFAQLQEATSFQTVFYVQNVQLEWDAEEGFKLTCDFVNFIAVREEQGAAPAQREDAARVQDDEGLPEDVRAIVEGRDDLIANQVRLLYRERQTLEDQRAAGEIDNAYYTERSAQLDEEIPSTVQLAESGALVDE